MFNVFCIRATLLIHSEKPNAFRMPFPPFRKEGLKIIRIQLVFGQSILNSFAACSKSWLYQCFANVFRIRETLLIHCAKQNPETVADAEHKGQSLP